MKQLRYRFGLVRTVLVAAFVIAASMASVSAQEITAAIEGTILTPAGQPATGVVAVVTDSRDGRSQSASADSRGLVQFRSVSAGGPYTIRISGSGYQDMSITDLHTDVAGVSSFTVTLTAASSSIEEVVVTAAQIQAISTATGPSSTFSLEQITDMPSTTRQIRDIIRIDPRVSIGRTGDGGDQSGAISCLGGSSRTNSFTVDGVRATDAFGLNLSGNLSRFSFPIPFDTVSAAAVEFAPISVEYGQFSGCNVNVVTKSGGNEFHGGAFWLYNDDGMTGAKIDGQKFDQGTFERENYGFDVGGPIIKDHLFFYAAYEKFDTATVNTVGSADDTSYPRNDTIFTTAELTQISDILATNYGRETGPGIRNLPQESERVFVRFDWNINDKNRVEASYTTVDEATTIGDDIGGGRGEYTFADNFHARGSESETMGIRLYSDWTDRFSTEIRYSTQEVIDLQNPVGGGEAQDAGSKPRIALSPFFASEFAGSEYTSGPGTFRSANQLETNKDQFKIKFDWQLGDHLVTGGYEYETLDVFNLFIINATGTVFFGGAGQDTTQMIADLNSGTAFEIISANTFTGVPDDAAAAFTRDIHSVFLQDNWDLSDNWQLILGLRYDWYESSDLPLENPNYVSRYGMTNQVGFDGLDILQPRIGLNYNLPNSDTRLSFGIGVFAGNDPTVWFSNAYQNFGGALGRATAGGSVACDGSELNVLPGGPGSFTGIPDCVLDTAQAQALATAGTVNATDPNFQLPNVTRYSFGIEHNTDSGWNLQLDLIYADLKDQVAFVDLSLDQVGVAPDGRPTYQQVDVLQIGCDATFDGVRAGYSGVTPACLGGNQDVFFTNQPGNGGDTLTLSLQGSKNWDFDNGWSMNFTGGYAYNESEIANSGSSFTAAENFRAVVATDIVNLDVGPSWRNNKHNFVISTTWSKQLFGDNRSSISLFFQRRAGSEISAVFDGVPYSEAIGDTSGGRTRNMLYVPEDENDPMINYGPGFDTEAFFSWADKNGLKRGAIAQKGDLSQSWTTDLDMRFQQEIPFFGKSKAKIYVDIENILNLINDTWGTKTYVNTQSIPSAVGVVTANINAADPTMYDYASFSPPSDITSPDTWDSLYRIQVGIRADF